MSRHPRRRPSGRHATLQVELMEPRLLLASSLLQDLNAMEKGSAVSSPVAYDGRVYYVAQDGSDPLYSQLYETDGTDAGTRKIAGLQVSTDARLVVSGGSLYLAAKGLNDGPELWKITGTAAPVEVKDLNPGPSGSYPTKLTSAGGLLYFSAVGGDLNNNAELWRSDGTEAGTFALKNEVSAVDSSDPGNLTAVGSTLFFSASPYGDRQLYKTDGTVAGTVLVKSFGLPGSIDRYVSELNRWASVGDTLYFVANDGTHGFEVWKSDGTDAGTVIVKDINPGQGDSLPTTENPLTAYNGSVYFAANDGTHGFELWKTDGTGAGTVMVKDMNVGTSTDGSYPAQLTVLGGSLLFTAYEPGTGTELWKTDGTDAGTVLVKDIRTGSLGSSAGDLAAVGQFVFFTVDDGTHGNELWKTDGTDTGTVLVKDIRTGPVDSNIGDGGLSGTFASIGGTVYFSANDGVHGDELWRSDGTDAGTAMVKNLRLGTDSSNPTDAVVLGGFTYFLAASGESTGELWRTDGTSAGTTKVTSRVSDLSWLVLFNGTLYFQGTDATYGAELWASDGTDTGTRIVQDVFPGAGASSPSQLTSGPGGLYFTADDPNVGTQLYRTDGTAAGTAMVKAINTGWQGTQIAALSFIGGLLYFSADDGVHGSEPWKSDGTEAGTIMIADVQFGPGSSYPTDFQGMGGAVYFVAADNGFRLFPVYGRELWKTDGTAMGTAMVKDILAGPGDGLGPHVVDASTGSRLVVIGSMLYFAADDGTHGSELWKSDGTAAGTVMVTDLYPDALGSSPTWLTAFNGSLYFAASGSAGNSLYRTDGTAAGTALMTSRSSASLGSPTHLKVVNATLHFTADDGVHGRELWKSDGTVAGTVLVTDIAPGAADSGAAVLGTIGANSILVSADDGIHGFEPFVVTGVASAVANDFDGDGKSDIGVYMPDSAQWVIRNSSGGSSATVWGNTAGTTTILSGDFDADGKVDIATYDHGSSVWYVKQSTGAAPIALVWGRAGSNDVPVVADFDGDGKADIAAYNPSTAQWFIHYTSGATPAVIVWGRAGSADLPVAVDFDGDGKADLTVFNPNTAEWIVRNSAALSATSVIWGRAGDVPVAADFDGDGKADIATYTPASATWVIRYSTGLPAQYILWGLSGGSDIPITGDYDGDGKADLAVYTPATSRWFTRNASGPLVANTVVWGRAGSGDVPLVKKYTVITSGGNRSVSVAATQPVALPLASVSGLTVTPKAAVPIPTFAARARLLHGVAPRSSTTRLTAAPSHPNPASIFKKCSPARSTTAPSPA
ncbi:FG-GAP-like repeat-containing protein [Isosphaeraceae bacterium EP7]